ncbi:MAG: hypothetical protein KAS30_02190 [Candidatus Diapherotrites archaeon]|nr:hypothetical protein [Candidatus Diapherotrites archaeon]
MGVLVTTSRSPKRKTRAFAREIAKMVSNANYKTRGKQNIDSLVAFARKNGKSRVIIVSERHGEPSKIETVEVSENDWVWVKEVFNIKHVILQKELCGFKTNLVLETINLTGSKLFVKLMSGIFDLKPSKDSEVVWIQKDNLVCAYRKKEAVGPSFMLHSIKDGETNESIDFN